MKAELNKIEKAPQKACVLGSINGDEKSVSQSNIVF